MKKMNCKLQRCWLVWETGDLITMAKNVIFNQFSEVVALYFA